MAFSFNPFKKKKKPATQCSICKSRMEYEEGSILTSSQIITSNAFWDKLMVEPETLSYTKAHFESQDAMATKMRGMIFNKYSEKDQAWIVCDSCIGMFNVEKKQVREHARKWWETNKTFRPPSCGKASEQMDDQEYQTVKTYAVMQAGERFLK
ncbi:hypothetical protein QQ020_20005 [Fulvivirgaceae bacterium BMA12]|uniref:Uncharacterized protein n=1 Tax=Agaribacillus aureus TaxID=3051825 RepID=A0ABT8L9C8_9BACT|nr:hypothetical protein [Fulvivirgaceae bacterium BMA12]